MKKQINEIKRMQQLAGLINESQINEVLPIDGELMDDDTFVVDFDDMGNLWADEFEKKAGHEYDDLNDEDNDMFRRIQDEVVKDLEDRLSNMYDRPIKLKYEY